MLLLTLMVDATSFLITERSRVNLHIYNERNRVKSKTDNTKQNYLVIGLILSSSVVDSSPQSLCPDRAPQQGRHCED